MNRLNTYLDRIARSLESIERTISLKQLSSSKDTYYPDKKVEIPKSEIKKDPYSTKFPNSRIEDNTMRVSLKEYFAMKKIANALMDTGSHPKHHDYMIRELQNKWPTLYKALMDLVEARGTRI